MFVHGVCVVHGECVYVRCVCVLARLVCVRVVYVCVRCVCFVCTV